MSERSERPDSRAERSERPDSRAERSERPGRPERSERPGRPERSERPGRPVGGGLLGPDRLLAVADAALALPGVDEVEATVAHGWGALTRFARSEIHQHVASEDTTISVRVAVDGHIGTASSNDATPEGAARAAEAALAAARLTPADPVWPGLAGHGPTPGADGRWDEATSTAGPKRRADAVAALLERLRPGQVGAGAVSTSSEEVAFATTSGARHVGTATRAAVSTVILGGGGASGHAEDAGVALEGLDPGDAGERAASTCAAAADPGNAPPGEYEVVLLPSAVATLLEYLGFITFSGKAVNEGRSAFSGHLGEQLASPAVSIVDDALGAGAMGLTFDGEGTPKSRIELLTDGVVTGVVHDRASAAAAGTASTGHGSTAPNPFGPVAGHLVLEPGDASVDDLVAGVGRGLLVTRLWYVRTTNPKRTLITGMTRDGTFRIDGGVVGAPVRNLRFNQSILDALATCDGVGSELRVCSDEWPDTRCPALRVRSFTFSSASDH